MATPARDGSTLIRARVHDRKSPSLDAEWRRVELRWAGGGTATMRWYGEYLWRGFAPGSAEDLAVCASDRQGNETCVPVATAPDAS